MSTPTLRRLLGGAGLAVATAASLNAGLMTFESLTPDFSEYASHTEDGLTLAATVAPNHFHAVSSPDLSSVAAEIHSLEGTPQRITTEGGSLFNLESFDLLTLDAGSTLSITANNGASLSLNAPGPVVFPAAWQNLLWVELGFGSVPPDSFDSAFTIDNIALTPVPEPGEWGLIAGAACLVAGVVARRTKRQA